jgi:hypothetical protein
MNYSAWCSLIELISIVVMAICIPIIVWKGILGK